MKPTADRRQWVLAALDQYESRLVRYATRLLGDADQARDVVQFAFLRLCDQSKDAIGDRLAQWLYTVCRNRALDLLREKAGWALPTKNGPACPVPAAGLNNERDGGQNPPYEPASREHDPADMAEQGELHALLRVLVAGLPENQREAIDLWADGFRYRQIAAITGHEEGHVRVLVHRGLKALREHPRVRPLLDGQQSKVQGPTSKVDSPKTTVLRGSPVHGALPR